MKLSWLIFLTLALLPATLSAAEFEGRIHASLTRGGASEPWLWTAGTNWLRVEIPGDARPNAVNLLNRATGELTLLFPHNRSFVKLKPAAENAAALPPGMPAMPMPAPASASAMPAPIGPTNLLGMPAPPTMPMMMMMPGEQIELTATGDQTNLLGYACEKFQIKQRGEVMEIWATKELLPFQNYLRNQRPRFGPRMIEERWGDLLTAKKLFPLRAVLKFENGPERLRFEVQSVTPEKLKPEDAALFLPPPDYQEIQPLPF